MTTSLSAANTLGVPSQAEHLVTVRSEDDLAVLAERLRDPAAAAGGLTVLGGGSNVVLRRRIGGVVCLMRTRGVRLDHERGGARLICAAGECWHDVVRYALGQGLAGLENLALIPGSAGAAPIQNIGAYGVELAERFVEARVLDTATGRVHVFDHGRCEFGYRDSFFKKPEAAGLIILDVTLRLSRRAEAVIDYPDLQLELARLGWQHPTPVQVAEAVIRVRRRKLPDPRFVGNAGSFFKNPVISADQAEYVRRLQPSLTFREAQDGRVKLSAAQLIDACGWKGRNVCGVGVWPRQPLVLVNRGGATGADFLAVSEEIRRDVAARFAITLEREPQVIGQD